MAVVKRESRRFVIQVYLESIIAYSMLLLGLLTLLASVFWASYIASFIGLGLVFWGCLLLYVRRTKYVKAELLGAASSSSLANIERILVTEKTSDKGIYLPPRCLMNYQTSLVFVPFEHCHDVRNIKSVSEEAFKSEKPKGIFLTPPGLALSRLFEAKLGVLFTDVDLVYLQHRLPGLLKELEIAAKTGLQIRENTVEVVIGAHIFRDLCEETKKLSKTHETLGCTLSSSLACVFAKATGKPVVIENEQNERDGTTSIQYSMMEA